MNRAENFAVLNTLGILMVKNSDFPILESHESLPHCKKRIQIKLSRKFGFDGTFFTRISVYKQN
nr:MAG TPA: hypothetical protein [Caudoviricetes sp.]